VPEGVATADDVAVGEPAGFGVPVGDAELVGLAFGVRVDVAVGVGVGVGGDVVRAGAVEVEVCPEGLLTVAVCAGATSP
jgi:hypothetical protein